MTATHSAPSVAKPRPRRSPNRERLIARVAMWTVVFPSAAFIASRFVF